MKVTKAERRFDFTLHQRNALFWGVGIVAVVVLAVVAWVQICASLSHHFFGWLMSAAWKELIVLLAFREAQ